MIRVKDLMMSQPCKDEMINLNIDGKMLVMEPEQYYEMCKSFLENNKLETVDEFLERKMKRV